MSSSRAVDAANWIYSPDKFNLHVHGRPFSRARMLDHAGFSSSKCVVMLTDRGNCAFSASYHTQ